VFLNVSGNSHSHVGDAVSIKYSTPGAVGPLKELPSLSLGSPAATTKVEEAKHYAAGISNFLPTTWRISQFANNRVPKR
jgi:hypothetical protein